MNSNIFHSRRRPLYPNGPSVSTVGFGTYRIGFSEHFAYPQCANALELALRSGINLIDTSSNYGFGESEKLVGKVLNQLFTDHILERENVVVVSKFGYLQGEILEQAKKRTEQGNPYLEVSTFGEDLSHCIHPEFIFDQIEISRKKLGLETLDVYLLHNPEYTLKRFELDGMEKAQAQSLFYHRLKASFQALETLVQQGKINAYGISSNNFGAPDDEFCCVSIQKCHELAVEVSQDHHFKVVQMPLNWLEVSPLFYEIGLTGKSTISYAQEHKIGVLINRPFNAMINNELVRLTRPQISKQDALELDEDALHGLENWTKLSSDLEFLARKQLEDMPGYEDATLSQLVLATLAALPGVSSVLCGMRQERYVSDIQRALERPVLLHAKNVVYRIYENLEFH